MNTLEALRVDQKRQNLWRVLFLRSVLFLAEMGLGLWSGSLSLLAGSGHLFSDLVTLALTLLIAWLIQKQTTTQSASRFWRLEAWVALLNGASLGAISLLIAWEGVNHLQTPAPVLGLPMLIAAGLSFVINGISIYLLHEDSHHDLNVRGIVLHGVADAASSISLVLAALAVCIFNWLWADAVGSLLVSLFICLSAGTLIQESLQLLSSPHRPDKNI